MKSQGAGAFEKIKAILAFTATEDEFVCSFTIPKGPVGHRSRTSPMARPSSPNPCDAVNFFSRPCVVAKPSRSTAGIAAAKEFFFVGGEMTGAQQHSPAYSPRPDACLDKQAAAMCEGTALAGNVRIAFIDVSLVPSLGGLPCKALHRHQ
ncbi:MAG: hypothetical protein ABJA84_05815 [Polaromonas sp.]